MYFGRSTWARVLWQEYISKSRNGTLVRLERDYLSYPLILRLEITLTSNTKNLSFIKMRLFVLWRRRGIVKKRHVREVALIYRKEFLRHAADSSTKFDALERIVRSNIILSTVLPQSSRRASRSR